MPVLSSGTIVEARHRHGYEDVRNVFAFDDLFAHRWVGAVVRNRRALTPE